MNATALLSRMFDRWYRRQIARQHLLDRVRLGGHRVEVGLRAPASVDLPPGAGRPCRPVSGGRRSR